MLWPDGDGPGERAAVRAKLALRRAGRDVAIRLCGSDVTAWAVEFTSEADERAALMRSLNAGDADADAAGVEPAAAVTFHAADPTGPDGDVVLPSAILSDGGGVILPAGEIGLFAGSGGSGKSRLGRRGGGRASGDG